LVNKFAEAGISLFLKDITQEDIGIPTFLAGSVEWITSEYGYLAEGFGTHPDARIALGRAITEVSQTRAGNIQGARDDLEKVKYEDGFDECRCWQFSQSKNRIKFSDVKTYLHRDILGDIKLILGGLKRAGLKRALIVDLSVPEIGIPVVRAIVPGLENFSLIPTVMGRRAKELFRRKMQSSS